MHPTDALAHTLLPIGTMRECTPYPSMELDAGARAAVTVEERIAPGAPGCPPVRVLVYRPRGSARRRLPLVIRLHGGSFVRLRADSFPAVDAEVARWGAHVVSVDYRLAPEHRFPAAVDDCFAALAWAAQESDVDASRIVVTGSSAGGALAAALTLLARDRGGPSITSQVLHVPALDDRLVTASMRRFAHATGFDRRQAEGMWLHYLGGSGPDTSPLAAPARADDLGGLPAAFIQVNELDPLRDEGIDYAIRLLAAGVQVELYCAPGLSHGVLPSQSSQAAKAQRILDLALRAALGL